MFHRESGYFKTTYQADMALFPLPIGKAAAIFIAVVFFVICPLILGEYYLSIINIAAIAVVGALGLNILLGYTGQISIGHAAFMSVGAYTAANFAVHLISTSNPGIASAATPMPVQAGTLPAKYRSFTAMNNGRSRMST